MGFRAGGTGGSHSHAPRRAGEGARSVPWQVPGVTESIAHTRVRGLSGPQGDVPPQAVLLGSVPTARCSVPCSQRCSQNRRVSEWQMVACDSSTASDYITRRREHGASRRQAGCTAQRRGGTRCCPGPAGRALEMAGACQASCPACLCGTSPESAGCGDAGRPPPRRA